MVAVSHAPSPESNPDSPLPVISMVGLYPTICLIGQSFVWSIAERILLPFVPPRSPEKLLPQNRKTELQAFSLCCDSLFCLLSFSSVRLLSSSVIVSSCYWHFCSLLLPSQKSLAKGLNNFLELTNAAFSRPHTEFLRRTADQAFVHVLALQLTGLSICF